MKIDWERCYSLLFNLATLKAFPESMLMRRISSEFTFIIFFLLQTTYCFAWSGDQAVQPLDSMIKKYPAEKVHLHLDKTNYGTGEMIWFKAYVTDESNLLSTLSGVLYVDLIDKELRVVSSLKLQLSSGLASGNIFISDKIKNGDYELRAYTRWMRNFGEESFFSQRISIGKISSTGNAEKNPQPHLSKDKINLKFFPEGGSLIDGVRSKIAFKASNSHGQGISVSGYVVDDQGLRVAEFESEHAGIGAFMFTPYHSKYTAVISSPEGEKKFSLPESKKNGYVLQVLAEDTKQFSIRIISGKKPERSADLAIMVRSGSQTHYIMKFKLSGIFTELTVSKENLPEGIVQLSLLDQNSIPLAERLIYNRLRNHQDFKLINDTAKYKINQKIRMQWAVFDKLDLTTPGSFSVSVTRLDPSSIPFETERTIFSDLLLASELKKHIEESSYYFADTSSNRRRQLDQLLLTQDWYRWTVKDIVSGLLPLVSYQPEQGLSVSGLVMSQAKPVINGKVSLFSPGIGVPMDTLTDQYGRFNFDRLVFQDSTRFVLQARTPKGKDNIEILLDSEPARMTHSLPWAMSSTGQHYQTKEVEAKIEQDTFADSKLLEEVVVSAVKDSREVRASSKLGNTGADFVFRPSQLSGTNLGDALVGKINGLEIIHDPRTLQTFAYLRRNKLQSGNAKMQMRVFIDNVDYGYDLSMVGMSEIATVEIFKGGAGSAIYGDKGFGGVIIITTKTFGERVNEVSVPVKGIIQITPKGFSESREFYLSKDERPDRNPNQVDYFYTLYWNPEITQKDGKLEFSFSTGNRPGQYKMIIEGIDREGRIGRKTHVFNIQE